MQNITKTICLLCLCGQLAAQSQAVVRVELFDGAEVLLQTGSGVVVSDLGPSEKFPGWYENHIVTCSHVIDASFQSVHIVYRSGERVKFATVVANDKTNDIAILKAIGPSKAKDVVGLGVFEVGKEYKHDGWKSRGDCRGSLHTSGRMFFDGRCSAGDSGGAVFDSDGRLVGVIQGGWLWLEDMKTTWPIRTAGRDLIESTLRGIK